MTNWQQRGACTAKEHAWLPWDDVPEPDVPFSTVTWRMRDICATCPVRQQCQDFAETHDVTSGFWAGTNYTRPLWDVDTERPAA